MRETPNAYRARTGCPPPTADVSIAGALLGTVARPPADDEECPTLYRDVGPQALAAFLDGRLTRLDGPASLCVFLRDASLPPYSACASELGLLVFLQPLTLGPWLSGQAGIWVAERGRMPAPGTVAFAPPAVPIPDLDRLLTGVPDAAALREALGGEVYDARVREARERLDLYLEDWRAVEVSAAPLRAVLTGPDEGRREELRRAMATTGVTEKDLRAPWFHLRPERRASVRPVLADLATRFPPSFEEAR